MLDVAHRRWSKEILQAVQMDESFLPDLYESPEICGRISAAGAAATGLKSGTPVVAGAGDQAAGAIGMGIVSPGKVSATIGTSGVVFAATARPSLDPSRTPAHVLSRASRALVRHGRDPGRGTFSSLVPGPVRLLHQRQRTNPTSNSLPGLRTSRPDPMACFGLLTLWASALLISTRMHAECWLA